MRVIRALLLTLCVCAVFGVSAFAQNADSDADSNRQESLSAKVLIVGGGSAHDFDRWFNEVDSETLESAGADVEYTDQPRRILGLLGQGVDVLSLTNNKPMPGEKLRDSIFRFADNGNGILIVHASVWYNWEDWPRYNRELVAGGSRSHVDLGEFSVEVTDPDHPVMEGVPANFSIVDELYRYEHGSDSPSINVLARGTNPNNGESYPVVWTVDWTGGRILCTSLGHDGRAHNHEAYKTLIRNAVEWLAQQEG